MSPQMNGGFLAGAGVTADSMKLTLQLISSGVIFMVFAWIILQIHLAYKNERVVMADAIWSAIKATVLMGFLFVIVLR